MEKNSAFGEKGEVEVTSPAQHNLLYVNEDSEILDKNKIYIFHSVTEKLLHTVKQRRPDLDTIKGKRIIGTKILSDLYTWIDAAYAVRTNMIGHAWVAISMKYVIIHRNLSKQKINVKSSTESELVRTGKYVPYNIWFMMFMSAQGYGIENNVIYQYNQSTMCMDKNGRS